MLSLDGFTGEFSQMFKDVIAILHKFSQNIQEEGTLPTHFMRPVLMKPKPKI